MRNIKLDLCYEGTRYRGWQRQPGVDNTIQGKLEQTLSRILEEPIEIFGSGRTDAGTHALNQVASFHCSSTMPAEKILEELRRYLPEDIGIYSCRDCSPRFHARLNARKKTYRYRVWNSVQPCVFDRRYVHIDPSDYNVAAMNEAARQFVGQHDFSAFCATHETKKSTVRAVTAIEVSRVGEEIRFTVTGTGFLRHMVRIMVGTLLEIGRGEREASSIVALFGEKREKAGELMPAKGLCLMGVEY